MPAKHERRNPEIRGVFYGRIWEKECIVPQNLCFPVIILKYILYQAHFFLVRALFLFLWSGAYIVKNLHNVGRAVSWEERCAA